MIKLKTMLKESKVPTYQDILQLAKEAKLPHDSILYSPIKQLFTIKKNIVTRETPKEFATEYLKLLNSEIKKHDYTSECVLVATKKDSKTDELIANFKIN